MTFKTVLSPSDIATKRNGPFNDPISFFQLVIATAVLNGRVIDKPTVARDFSGRAITGGTVADTVVMLKKIKKSDGTTVSMLNTGLTLKQADTDPVAASTADWVSDAVRSLEPGDVIYAEVTTASTGGASMFLTCNLDERFDDAVEKTEPGMGGGTP